jgi:NAD(P)-dependent dehydrogenase (short-subunit alcohol dehydrogenase family)
MPNRKLRIQNRKSGPVIVITGASQGIGEAIAKAFAKEAKGARLALVARNEKNLRAVARACAKLGATAEAFPCDVSDEKSVAAMARAVTKRFGPADVLVNNAGKFLGAPFLEMTTEMFDAQLAGNLRSVFLVSRAFVPAMAKRRRGDVFNLSSIAGLQAYGFGAAYCASKFGVTGLTRVMRAELKDKGVRVCGVYPGAVWTPSWKANGFTGEKMMPAADIAQAIVNTWKLGRATVTEDIILRPQWGDLP